MLIDAKLADTSDLNSEIENLASLLQQRGVFIRLGKDFTTFAARIQQTPERAPLHEQFAPDLDMDGAQSAFWICGYDEDGDLVHTQAAHLLDLTGKSIAAHIDAHQHNYFPKSPPVIRSTVKPKAGPRSSSIDGMVAYHGEMWLRKDLRDQGTAAILIRLGLLVMVREWDPDAVFGLMNWSLACRGFNMRIGYHHSEPMTVTWDRSDSRKQHQVWLVYLEREDIKFLMQMPIVEFSAALANDFR
mgnify:CR=1 FL=1